MKLFTIGPVTMHERTLKVKSQQMTHFRTSEFSEVALRSAKILKEITKTKESSKVFFLTCSGTGAMEASIINTLTKKDKVLIIDGGIYGARFKKMCDIYKIPNDSIELEIHESLEKKHFLPFENNGYTAILVNLHETSVGQLFDIQLISSFAKRNNLLLIVDAISTFLCDEYNMDKWGIDVSIISSQKGLALDPGLGIIIVNEKTYNEKVCKSEVCGMYFDLKLYAKYMENGQTPFTPAIEIMFELDDMLKYVLEKGVSNIIKENNEKATAFRQAIKNLPITYPKTKMSNALTPLYFNQDVNASLIYQTLKQFGILVNFDTAEEDSKLIRVCHVGNTTTNDMLEIIRHIETIIK